MGISGKKPYFSHCFQRSKCRYFSQLRSRFSRQKRIGQQCYFQELQYYTCRCSSTIERCWLIPWLSLALAQSWWKWESSSQWFLCDSVPEIDTDLGLSQLDRRQLGHSETLIGVEFSFCLHKNIWGKKTSKMTILYNFFPKNRTQKKNVSGTKNIQNHE